MQPLQRQPAVDARLKTTMIQERRLNRLVYDISFNTCQQSCIITALAKDKHCKKVSRKAGRGRGRDTCFHSSPVYFLVVLPVSPPSTCLQKKTQDANSTKNNTGTFPPPFQRQSGSAPRHTIRTRNHDIPFPRNSWVERYGGKTKTSDVLNDGNVRLFHDDEVF